MKKLLIWTLLSIIPTIYSVYYHLQLDTGEWVTFQYEDIEESDYASRDVDIQCADGSQYSDLSITVEHPDGQVEILKLPTYDHSITREENMSKSYWKYYYAMIDKVNQIKKEKVAQKQKKAHVRAQAQKRKVIIKD